MADESAIRPDASLLAAVEARSGEKVSACYHCRKCTCGCPLAFAMDVMPNQVMRMIQLGMTEELLGSRTIWICASCQACTTRCPNEIDIAHVMDTLRQMSLESEVPAGEADVVKFHRALLDSVRLHGRVFELGLVARYKLAARDPFGDVKLGLEMFKRGKLSFLPERVRARSEVRRMFDE